MCEAFGEFLLEQDEVVDFKRKQMEDGTCSDAKRQRMEERTEKQDEADIAEHDDVDTE